MGIVRARDDSCNKRREARLRNRRFPRRTACGNRPPRAALPGQPQDEALLHEEPLWVGRRGLHFS